MAGEAVAMPTKVVTMTTKSPERLIFTEELFNSSLMDDHEKSHYYVAVLYTVVAPILYGAVTVLGVAGNLLVIYVILTKEGMRTVTNLLLLNLAVADLCFVVVIPPFTAYQFVNSSWPFGSVECRLMHFLVNVTAYVTVYTLVLIAVVRYLTIVHGPSTVRIRTRSKVVVMIFSIWIVMLLVNCPVLTCYEVILTPTGSIECDIVAEKVGQWLFATFFTFAYVLPLAAIATLSFGILHSIARHRRSSAAKGKTTSKRKQKAGRMLVQVVVVFAVLWLPIHVHLLLSFFGSLPESTPYTAISVLWNCLAYFNSCVNPIIYNRSSRKFRTAFIEVGRCGRGLANGPGRSTAIRLQSSEPDRMQIGL